MKAVIMAGGSGTRLRPLTCTLPKPMVPVMNKPMAEHIVNLLREQGFKDLIFTLHYLPQVISDYFGDGSKFGTKIGYSTEEESSLRHSRLCQSNSRSIRFNIYRYLGGQPY